MFKQHEKFWSFIFLLMVILILGMTATFLGNEISRGQQADVINEAAQAVLTSKLRILELIAVGLIGIAGAAGQSLFRTSENAAAMNEILSDAIQGLKTSTPAKPITPIIDDRPPPRDAIEGARQVEEAAVEEREAIERSRRVVE